MSKRILIISDSDSFRLQAMQYLSMEWPNVDIEECDPKTDSIDELAPVLGDFDGILLDHQSGGPDGLEWLKLFKQKPGCPPVIFLTEYGNPAVNQDAVTQGADYCLSKYNLTHTQFVGGLRRALGSHTTIVAVNTDFYPPPQVSEQSPANHVPIPDADRIEIRGYQIMILLGQGGMSTVYLAERLRDHRQVVLKVLDTTSDDSDDTLQRFIEEYRMISTMETKHVVRIFDQGFTDRHCYIVMEFLPSGDLLERVMRGLTSIEALDYLRRTGEALEEIHRIGILHRDIKPQNVMFRKDGTLVLVDFGVAKQIGGSGIEMAKPGWIYGTPGYMSPEQARGGKVDQRCDLYSAGVVFYEMLTGELPNNMLKRTSVDTIQSPTDIPELQSHLAEFQPLIDKLLAPDPADRYQSATELLADIDLRWPKKR